ncbi:MAG TPA: ABC transporter ATP-binding protein [Candidatus Saccharimonadales bacterium]|nr:ABC transporter ATP-binding protein [Candidatus Saccharimonadales bacterium]
MKNVLIEVDHVNKHFILPSTKANSLKQLVLGAVKKRKNKRFDALKDISFQVNEGDFLGIVGRNGSGKSTLLKMLAGVYTPNEGKITVNGSLTPFIELGVGFNPELSGRENVFLNGALLGFTHKQMAVMYQDIVDFAELEQFMDQKLKNYSSGMQVRLAFSIAIRAHSDILLIDEVLAVGDEAFQRKCFNYFDELKRNNKTVILVTHDMGAVERFCNRAIFIEDGVIKLEGKPHLVAAAYSRSNDESYNKAQEKEERKNRKEAPFDIELLTEDGVPSRMFGSGDTMIVRLTWGHENVGSGGVALFCEGGEYVFGPNTYQDKFKLTKPNSLDYVVELNLNEGQYFVKAGINGKNDFDRIAFIEEGPHFTISRDQSSPRWGGITKLKYHWR